MSINKRKVSPLLSCLLLLYLFPSPSCTATNTITANQTITDGETIISADEIFELGFFSPGNSSNRYVGIWYNEIPGRKVIWVANRVNPLSGSSGVLTFNSDGNLVLLDGRRNPLWSTKASSVTSNNSVFAVLLDSGNLVLRENKSDRVLWQSFDYPSNSLLPNMKVGFNTRTGQIRNLTSWKSEDDPSPGNFVLVVDYRKPPQIFIMNGSDPLWRTGKWNGRSFIGIPHMSINYLDGFDMISDKGEGTTYFTYSLSNSSYIVMVVLDSSGTLKQTNWEEANKEWTDVWNSSQSQCNVYGTCGTFGICNEFESSICRCLKGFEPRFSEEWRKGNWSGGCVRRAQLQCQKNKTSLDEDKGDGFLKLGGMKLPDFGDYLDVGDAMGCKDRCANNCSCVAYAYVSGIGCMVWGGELIDVREFPSGGEELFLRLATLDLGTGRQIKVSFIIPITITVTLILGALAYILYCWKAKQRETSTDSPESSLLIDGEKQAENIEFRLFDLSSIVIATNTFSTENKLGEGGFGSVYKGKLPGGQEVAVKRLSKSSRQGIEEFKNEVILISKLQHMNLVRLVGCCIAGEEKMLLYEFMPNKSLDVFLFDPTKGELLDWAKRFNIIEGIARGMLYLHRDSRLRVIHRDLKTSNILLDEDMNPKISDFGLARIFGRKQTRSNTNRVVGTYGYMSPEYAMEGIFSEKSDVFSFGVMLLEIVSSKRNNSFYQHEQNLNLLGYVWRLWNEGKGESLIDPRLADSCSANEAMRCIHVGLLCVQEHANDRPTMSAIVVMLGSETTLPTPKQPAFILERSPMESGLSSQNNNICSINEVSITNVEGR